MNDKLSPNIQDSIEKIVYLNDFAEKMARRAVQLGHAREVARLIHFNELEVHMCEVNTQGFGLNPEESQCALCLGPLVQEKAYLWWWGKGAGYVEFAHVLCTALAKNDGITLAPIDWFTGKREAQDDGWAHRIGKCSPSVCVWCQNGDGA